MAAFRGQSCIHCMNATNFGRQGALLGPPEAIRVPFMHVVQIATRNVIRTGAEPGNSSS